VNNLVFIGENKKSISVFVRNGGKKSFKKFPIKKRKSYTTLETDTPSNLRTFPVKDKSFPLYVTENGGEYGNFKESEKFLLTNKDVWTDTYRIWLLDIETRGSNDPKKVDKEITSITFYDNFLDKYLFFSFRNNIDEPIEFEIEPEKYFDRNVRLFLFQNEEQMLLNFLDFTQKNNPDIISGWFSNSYDIPYILNRMDKLDIPKEYLSLTKSKYDVYCIENKKYKYEYGKQNQSNPFYVGINGINLIDYKDLFLKAADKTNIPNFSLDTFAKFILGEEYGKYGGHFDIEAFDKDFKKHLIYAIMDVHLLRLIEDDRKYFDYFYSMQRFVPLPPKDLFSNAKIILFAIQQYTIDKYRVKAKFKQTSGGEYKGAFVLNPVSGIFNNVVVFDYKSLYPSTMITFNLGVDTLRDSAENLKKYSKCLIEDDVEKKEYIFSNESESEVIKFVRELYEARFKLKKTLKKMDKNHPDYHDLYQQQYALKILMNSIYGVMGFQNFPLFSLEVAESITGMARNVLMWTKEFIENNYGDDVKILYGDTDSLFVHFKNAEEKDKLMVKIRDDINKNVKSFVAKYIVNDDERIENHKFEIEIDKIFDKLILQNQKKRYFGRFDDGEIYISGMEIIKKDTPEYFKKILQDFMEELLDNRFVAIEKLEKWYEEMQTVEIEKIGAPVSFNKDIETGYTKNLPQHVRAARWSNKYLGQNIQSSDKPLLYYVKMSENEYEEPTDVVVIKNFNENTKSINIDWGTTFYKQFLKKIENLGLNETNLIIKEYLEKHPIIVGKKPKKKSSKKQKKTREEQGFDFFNLEI